MNGSSLCGSRVVLGPLAEDDSDVLWSWINTRELILYNAPYRPVHQSAHRAWFADVCQRQDLVLFAIRERNSGRLIGVCQLHTIHPVHHSAELQIRIGDAAWRGKGCGREALGMLLAIGFGDLNLRRIFLRVLADNTAAIRLYQSLGFIEEGRLREAVFVDGRYQDLLMMGLLQSEYRSPSGTPTF